MRNTLSIFIIGNIKIVTAVILLGSVCGLIEVLLDGFLRHVGFPYRAGLLTGIGFGIVAVGLAVFKKPLMVFGIGVVTVLCKQLVIPVLGVSVMCKLNSCVAVILEYGSLSLIASYMFGSISKNVSSRVVAGGGGALLGSLAFFFIGMHVAPCRYLLSFNSPAGFGSYLMTESLSWVFFSVLFFPLGWKIGELISEKTLDFIKLRSGIYYAGSAAISLSIWLICAFAISRGI